MTTAGPPSATTSAGALSSRRPLYDGARSWLPCVHSRNSTSATQRGSTPTAPPRGRGRPGAARGCWGRGGGEGGGRPLRGEEPLAEAVELGLGEAGADLPGVAQVAVLADADEQRADALAPAPLPRHPAADHDLLAVEFFALAPARTAPPRLVRRVEPLGDDALEALLGGRLEDLLAVPRDVVGRAPAVAVEVELGEPRAALLVGQVHERVPVEPEEVEDHVGDRRVLRQPPHRVLGGEVHAPLQRAEARLALRVERDDLAVED